MIENIDYVECKICKKQYKNISISHLKTHNISSIDAYKRDFNVEIIICQNVRNKLATNSLEHFIKNHGEIEGPIKYEEYKEFQRNKNSFEYKQQKYGWTQEEFDEFNASRAVTSKNLIKKYGEEKGLEVFNEYRKKQAKNGNSLEYFIEKYGEIEGIKKYKEVNAKKAITLENMIRVHGEVQGKIKYENWINNSDFFKKHSSLLADEFIFNVLSAIDSAKYKIYSSLTKEFCVYNDRPYFYDLVILGDNNIKKCIEFHGDYWHANPKKYNKKDVLSFPRKC